MQKKADIWARYDLVLKAKEKCRPNGVIVTDVRAENVITHKVKRLLEMLNL